MYTSFCRADKPALWERRPRRDNAVEAAPRRDQPGSVTGATSYRGEAPLPQRRFVSTAAMMCT